MNKIPLARVLVLEPLLSGYTKTLGPLRHDCQRKTLVLCSDRGVIAASAKSELIQREQCDSERISVVVLRSGRVRAHGPLLLLEPRGGTAKPPRSYSDNASPLFEEMSV